jgi:hypothetical protein
MGVIMSTNQITNRKQDEVIKMLGPIEEVTIKMKLPAAIIEYINEVAIKEKGWNSTIDEYCNEEILQTTISHLDADTDLILKNHIIPALLANYDDEKIDATLGERE